MKKTIIYISDFFANEVNGGAELYGSELWKHLQNKEYDIIGFKSQNINIDILKNNKECFFVVSNFMFLSEQCKKEFINNNYNYSILEHDHKYVKSNNPALYPNLVIPEELIQNKDFYKNAKAVFCQSKLHADTLQKHLLLANIINLGCNLWSEEHLKLLKDNLNKTKTRKFGVMDSTNKNKGTQQTIEYCKKNNIQYELISQCSQNEFYKELSKTDTLVFFPNWMETYCRVAVEARILGCKLITNKMLGCSSEPYFNLKGEALLNHIKSEQSNVVQKIIDVIEDKPGVKFCEKLKLPKVSMITTIYNAEQFIEGYLESFKNQTYENKELIIIDANSNDRSHDLYTAWDINNRMSGSNLDIKYIKLNEQITPMKAFNVATEMASGEYISTVLIDDRLSKDYLETLTKHLYLDSTIDLVYADSFQTTKANETFENNSSRGKLFEHSRMEFSPENMIKCLPSPVPLYRKSMHEKVGGYKEELKHAGDWQLYLEAIRKGSKFKKINKPLALYLFNMQGLSTSSDPDKMKRRRLEEKNVFNEYKDIIGEKNYSLFKDYFNNI